MKFQCLLFLYLLILAVASLGVNAVVTITVNKKGYIVDCVPFDQQPGVLQQLRNRGSNTPFFVNKQIAAWDDSLFDFKRTDCPAGTVAIPRTDVIKKKNKNRQSKINNKNKQNKLQYNDAGYQYITSPTKMVAGANATYVTLSLEKSPIIIAGNNSHALNQLWWLTTSGGNQNTMSLETGWIACEYFTYPKVATTLFAYSTTDGYNGGSSDHYNYHGGFIGYSGAPTLATPVSIPLRFMFSYAMISEGYELSLIPFTVSNDGTYRLGHDIKVGYYPIGRYPGGVPQPFNYFQVGSEVYVGTDQDSVSMSGTIRSYGTRDDHFHINNEFFVTGQGNYNFTYQSQTWTDATFIGSTSVSFHGRN